MSPGDWLKLLSRRLRVTPFAIQWALSGALIFALCLRFALRAFGIRDDLPFPGALYALTARLVAPFYRFFPVSPRLDYHAAEWASLVAALVVLLISVAVYVILLFVLDFLARPPA